MNSQETCSRKLTVPGEEDTHTAMVERAQKAGKFTDTANFTLKCLVCQRGLKGEAEAVEHAKSTGHTNFSEFK